MNTNLPFAETFTLHTKVVLQTAQFVLSLCPQRLTTLREQAVGGTLFQPGQNAQELYWEVDTL